MADKVLFVGINAYPGCPLRGCLNDIDDMTAYVLAHKVGDTSQAFMTLRDGDATTANIRKGLQWLVADLKAGDRILFHYSGHGAQVATTDPDGGINGMDDVICPVDFDWSAEHLIRCCEFHALFAGIPEGVEANWVSDSCHSGDLSRDGDALGGRVSKTMIPPDAVQAKNQEAAALGFRSVLPPANIALVSGCRSDQTSADASFGGRANGALTFFLLKVLQDNQGVPLKDVIVKVREALRLASYEQVPQLSGPDPLLNKGFFQQG